jgi:hypothetical protein
MGNSRPILNLISAWIYRCRKSAVFFNIRNRRPVIFWEAIMPKFIIEREIPGAGQLTAAELNAISQTSCGVLRNMGSQIQWLESYVTADKVYCIYLADNEQLIREHAEQGGFPANRIEQIKTIIDPTTAE